MKSADKLMEIAAAMRRCREEGEFDSSYLRDWADGIEEAVEQLGNEAVDREIDAVMAETDANVMRGVAKELADMASKPDYTRQYTVSINGQFESAQTFVAEELARKAMSDWEMIAREHGWNDEFSILVRDVGPWKKLGDYRHDPA